jgi:DNA invertase Pin-like site-specific DNA recombinase
MEGQMTIYGYARVSSKEQTLDAQHEALRAAGCRKVFAEKQSGMKTDRAELAKAIAKLRADDVLIVTKIDRLARSTRELLNVIHEITAKGAGIKSLGDPLIDTTTAHGQLMLGILGTISQFERNLIRQRLEEGIARAKVRGVKFGRKPKLTHHQRQEAIARRNAGETLVDIARSYNVHHSMISRLTECRPATR